MPSLKWSISAAVCLLLLAAGAARADYLVVATQGTERLLRFNLATGEASVLGHYEPGAVPRNLAVDASGTIYSSLFGGNKNVVKFVAPPEGGPLVTEDFTPTIGGFGPGQIAFHGGNLYAAGDADDVIHQYDGQTGAEIRTFSASTSFNIRAMTMAGDYLYYAEIFQDRVNRFDLTQSPPSGGFFFQDAANLSEPLNVTIGHNGNLVFAGRNTPLIQEFDIDTGAFAGTIADLSAFASGISGGGDITYSPRLKNYFVSTIEAVFRFDPAGQLVQTYESPLMPHASGVLVVVPEPASVTIALLVVLTATVGLRETFCIKDAWGNIGGHPRI
jgi:hypothetical protein